MMFKVSESLASVIGLTKDATPEAFESRIIDLAAQVEGHQSMNKELSASVTSLEARILALENKQATINPELIKEIVAMSEAAAKMAAGQEVSAAIAKAGTISVPRTSEAETTVEVKTPSLFEQYCQLDPVAKRAFRAANPDVLKDIPILPPKL